MPIYAFQCSQCDHRFDRLQKLSDPDPDTCPQCGAAAVGRQVTAPAFRLAGSGWYETDFKKPNDKKQNLAGDSGSKNDGASAKTDAGTAGGESKSAPAATSNAGTGSDSGPKE